jgi:hypothetical protein
LETSQEARTLSNAELELIHSLKTRILGLAAVEKSRARQKSRVIWLKKEDANTNFFHIMVNIRKQRNYIHSLESDGNLALSQNDKQEAVYSHFQNHIGTYVPRACLLNLSSLDWNPQDLSHLERPFSKEEVKKVIAEAHKRRPLGQMDSLALFLSQLGYNQGACAQCN